jgi:hypothetical protein
VHRRGATEPAVAAAQTGTDMATLSRADLDSMDTIGQIKQSRAHVPFRLRHRRRRRESCDPRSLPSSQKTVAACDPTSTT